MRTLPREVTLANGQMCLLRAVKPEEAEAFLRYYRQVYAESNLFLLRDQVDRTVDQQRRHLEDLSRQGLMLGAFVDRQLVGHLELIRRTPVRRSHVVEFTMAILQDHHRLGLGRKMVEATLEWAKERGNIRKVALNVRSHNEAALALYQHLGFREEGRRVNEYRVDGQYVDEILIYLWLTPTQA